MRWTPSAKTFAFRSATGRRHDHVGGDELDDFYLNGEALVMASRLSAGLDVEPDGIEYN